VLDPERGAGREHDAVIFREVIGQVEGWDVEGVAHQGEASQGGVQATTWA
jgi:hypothetical protein